jgi:hypothetical protein
MDFDIFAPFDAVQTGTDQNGKPIYDRAHKAADLRAVQKAIVSNGVLPLASNLQVAVNENMTVLVKPGYVFIEGAIGYIKTDKTITIGTADGVLHRIDAVVARLDYLARKIVIDVVAGTPASNPAAPALTRSVDAYEMVLAYVRVNAGVTAIAAANITDMRHDSSVCGIAGNLMGADTDTLFLTKADKPAKVTTLTGGAVTIADNTIYVFTGVTAMAVTFPAGDFECLIDVTFGASASVTFPAGTVYLGGAPTFEASKRYEISIRNGVVCAAEVKAA